MSDRTKDLDVDASKAMEDARLYGSGWLMYLPSGARLYVPAEAVHIDTSKLPAQETTGRCPVAGCTNTDPQHIKHFTENGKG